MKKGIRRLSIAIFVLLVALVISTPELLSSEAKTGKVSRPFEYAGYSFPQYKSYTRSSHFVSMFDGTKLAVDVYLPVEGQSHGPFPVLFNYHPYRRATINPKTGEISGTLPSMEKFIKFFTSYGYAIVIGEMRGSGTSFGSRLDMSPPLAKDGKQLIDWIEMQPWCNGNVGMYGCSYMGWSQYPVAAQKPRALKAIMPEQINFDMFAGCLFYCGGIFNRALIDTWGTYIYLLDRAAYIPASGALPGPEGALFPAVPVVDEDGDGELADEIPQYPSGKPFFFDDPPTYSDGKKRQNIYYNAVREHLNNLDVRKWAPAAPYRNSQLADTGYTWTDLGPSNWPIRLSESGIAIYHVGGWFDIFTLGTTRWYATLRATNPSKMLIHPSFHSGLALTETWRAGPYWKYFEEDVEQADQGMLKERLRFFDRYLKGIKNGIDTEPPVYIYVMNGKKWRLENEWPLKRQVVAKYYFEGGNTLSKSRKTYGSDKYKADYTHDSRYGVNKATRWNAADLRDEPMKRTDKDRQCLTYTSGPLEKDTEVTGHPVLSFWVSSTADNGDFFVYLEDVDEKGEAYYVTEGKLRAGFAGLVAQEDMLASNSRIKILPNLPYHGFKDTDYVDGVFAKGNIVELVLDLFPTSWVFKKGHRIRLSIAAADWPTFDLHPKLSPKNNPSDQANTVPTITVYRDAKHPSSIELPIIPPKPRGTFK